MYCGLYSNNQFTVAPNCDVYKCWEHVGQEEHLMGKIDENGNLRVTYAYYDWMSVDPLKNAECSECVYLPVCGGGCGVVSYNETGTYHAKGCFKVKGTIEKQVLKYVEEITKANIDPLNYCDCKGGCGKE
ncbi:SPASM domain-containing protein [Keratinibaculum paraultunense]|nr:SPASM domain-containing protein [Keratinibaculum paraultunense]